MALADITAELERELEDSPSDLAALRAAHTGYLADAYPEPTEGDILGELEQLRVDFTPLHDQIRAQRVNRYQKARMPAKWRNKLSIEDGQELHSRLGHNMIMRVAAMATRNPPKFKIDPATTSDSNAKIAAGAQERAEKQTRWANNFWPAMERHKAKLRAVIDNQLGDGLGIIEIYRTGSYDKLDSARRDQETAHQYMQRTEDDFRRAGDPYRIRKIDPLTFFWDEEDDEICVAIIEQQVRRPSIDAVLRRKLGEEKFREWLGKATMGRSGQPVYGSTEIPSDTATCVKYYDKRWYAYFVDGVCVDGPVEHGMGFVPCVIYEGMTTGSPNPSERMQGVWWGLSDLELAIDWLLTLEEDTAFVLSKPKIAIMQPLGPNGGQRDINIAGPPGPPPNVVFIDGVVRLNAGETIINLTETFRGYDSTSLRAGLMQLIQISGLNPVAQGESPGSDPSGYALNSLQSAALSMYEVTLDNASRAHALLINYIRRLIKQDGLPWYLTAPVAYGKAGTAWLGLGPDDIDETPAVCTIDPLSDVNRIAVEQSKRQANKEGYISRGRVQEVMGVDDPDQEDAEIAKDTAKSQLLQTLIQQAMQEVIESGQPQQAMSGMVDQYGQPLPSSQPNGVGAGGVPAQPQPQTVGVEASNASQGAGFATKPGPASQQPMTASAGQAQPSRVA